MYAVSEAFKEAMKSPVQQFNLGGSILANGNRIYFTQTNVQKGTFKISNQCSGDSNVEIGTVYTGELTATFLDTNIQRYVWEGAVITPYFELKTANGYERVPLGIFNVTEANWTTFGIEVTAYDNMSKFDRTLNLSSNQYALDIYGYLSLASIACGVGMAQTEAQINALPNGNLVLTLYPENDMETYRDLISWCAQTLGCFATIDREGKLLLVAYGTTPVDTIDDEHRFTGAKFSDFETRYTGVSCVNIIDQTTNYYGLQPDDGLTYNLGSNPLLQVGDSQYLADRRIAVLNALAVIDYVPMEVSMIGTPAYDLGDVLVFSNGAADGTKLYCLTQYDWTYGGDYTIKGVGQNPAMANARSKLDKDISGLLSKQSENEISYYDFVNTEEHHIRDGNTAKIIDIKYATVKSTHVDFHAEVRCLVSTTETYDEDEDIYTEHDAVLMAIYKIDDYELMEYYPINNYFDGTKLLHLLYTWRSSAGLTSEFAVYLKVVGAELWIDVGACRGYIAGMGLVGDDAWDGSVKITQKVVRRDFSDMLKEFTDDVDADTLRPEGDTVYQNVVRVNFASRMLKRFTEDVESAFLHRFSVPYNDDDMFKSNIVTDGNVWRVNDQSDVGLVVTPVCDVSAVSKVTSRHAANTGSVTYIVSFDTGMTYYTYASGWQAYVSGDGMTGGVLSSITAEEWAEMVTDNVQIEAALTGDATLTDIQIYSEV